jgi:hypothetical protein
MTTTAPLRSAHRNWARPVRLENRLAYRLGHEAAGSVIPIAGGRIPPNGPSGIVESVPPESETSLEPQAAGRRPQAAGRSEQVKEQQNSGRSHTRWTMAVPLGFPVVPTVLSAGLRTRYRYSLRRSHRIAK